jgi:hypothetical protein
MQVINSLINSGFSFIAVVASMQVKELWHNCKQATDDENAIRVRSATDAVVCPLDRK